MAQAKLTQAMIAALRIGASRRSLLVSCGDNYPTAPGTLRALKKRGLVEFRASKGYTYGAVSQTQYRVTQLGRAALFECGEWSVSA